MAVESEPLNAVCVPKAQCLPRFVWQTPRFVWQKPLSWKNTRKRFISQDVLPRASTERTRESFLAILASTHGKTWWRERDLCLLASPTLPCSKVLSQVPCTRVTRHRHEIRNGENCWILAKLTNVFKPTKWVPKSHEPKKYKTCWSSAARSHDGTVVTVACGFSQ